MNVLKKILDLYINSSIHVALSVAVLCYVTGWYFHFTPPDYLVLSLFFGSVVGYNFIKYAPLAPNFISVEGSYLKRMQLFSLICFLAALYFLRFFSVRTLICVGVIGALVFFYVFPLHRYKGNIRSIKGVKVDVVAVVWALATVMLPVLESGYEPGAAVFIETFRRLIFVLAITIPFEIRDMDLDQPGLYTIPQQMGVRGAKLLGYGLLLCFWCLGWIMEVYAQRDTGMAEGVLVVISMLMVYGANRSQHRYYSGLLVESLPLVWMILLLIF